jgi:hypothetical protein
MRFASKDVSFKQFMKVISDCQGRLDLPYIVYTVNYAPHVLLGRTTDVKDTLDLQKRVDGVYTPIGQFMPMTQDHVRQLSYALLWNNYGKHNPNLISQVTSVVWDWTGLLKSFPAIAFAIGVQGNTFYMTSFSERDWRVCEDLLSQVDGGKLFRACPMPKVPRQE